MIVAADNVQSLLTRELQGLAVFVPRLAGAAIVLIVGWILALVIERLVSAALNRADFDGLAIRTGMIEDLARVGISTRPSRLIGRLAFLVVIAGTLVETFNALDLADVSRSLAAFVAFVPHVVIAIVFVLAGIIVGDAVGRGASGAMSRSGVLYHDITGGFVRTTIIIVAVLIALQQLTIESAFFFEILLTAFSALAFAIAIAVGWGGRHLAENSLSGRSLEKHFGVGDRIAFSGVEGTIERFETICTIVRTVEGRKLVVPNGVLTASIVEVVDERTS